MANEPGLRPGARVRCAGGKGIVAIVRRSRSEALIFFPAIRVRCWVDMEKLITGPQLTNDESEAQS
jgi:hypothetical protein